MGWSACRCGYGDWIASCIPAHLKSPHPSHSLVLCLKLAEVHVIEQYDATLDIGLAKRPDEVELSRIECRILRVLGAWVGRR